MNLPTPKLACEFLHVFSRFEYALKRTSFLKKGARGGAEADWDKFSAELHKEIKPTEIESEEFQEAVEYFFNHPPKKQIVSEVDDLEWRDEVIQESQRNFVKILALVRRVRNNLFHGGKFHGEYIYGSERDEHLIKFSLVILMECLRLNTEVETEFRKEIFNAYEN